MELPIIEPASVVTAHTGIFRSACSALSDRAHRAAQQEPGQYGTLHPQQRWQNQPLPHSLGGPL